jgi:hypothetical protein
MHNYIRIKDNIEFLVELLEIKREGQRLVCSLCGEFVKYREPLSPKMYYSMNKIGVISQEPEEILLPIYESLVLEREEFKK